MLNIYRINSGLHTYEVSHTLFVSASVIWNQLTFMKKLAQGWLQKCKVRQNDPRIHWSSQWNGQWIYKLLWRPRVLSLTQVRMQLDNKLLVFRIKQTLLLDFIYSGFFHINTKPLSRKYRASSFACYTPKHITVYPYFLWPSTHSQSYLAVQLA